MVSTDLIKSIPQQIDQFITDNASFLKDFWNNTLNEDYPFCWPAHDYHNFLKQIECVVKFYIATQYENNLLHHDIIEIFEDPDQAVLFEHKRSEGDMIMAELDADQPQLTFEIGEHRLSIIYL